MNRLDGPFEPVAAYHDADGHLAGALRDGDDVHVALRNRAENAPREPRRATHSLADNRQQSDLLIDVERLEITVGKLERETGFELFGDALHLVAPYEKTEALPVAGARECE